MREQVVRMRQNGARIANMSLSLLSSISLTFLIFNLRHAKRRVVSSAGRGTYNGGRGKKRVPSPLSSIHRRSRVSFEVKSEDPRSPSANPTRRSRALYSSVGIRVSRLARGSYLTTRQRFLTERKYLAFEDSFLPFIFSFFPPSSNSIQRLIFRELVSNLSFSRTFSSFSFLVSIQYFDCSRWWKFLYANTSDSSEKLQRIFSKISIEK